MDGPSGRDDHFCFRDFGSGIVHHKKILLCLERQFVLNNAVSRDPYADEPAPTALNPPTIQATSGPDFGNDRTTIPDCRGQV
jgi:hypothetical protein